QVGAHLLGDREPELEVDARERLSPIEGLPVAIVVAVVLRRKRSIPPHGAAEEPRGQRHARQNADVALLRLAEKELCRSLTKEIVNDLNARDARILNRLEPLFRSLDAYAIMEDLALANEAIQSVEGLWAIVDVRRRTVQLQEIEGLYAEVREAALDEPAQVLVGVSIGGVRLEAPAGRGG